MDEIFAILILLCISAVLLAAAEAVLRAVRIASVKKHPPAMPEKFTVTAHTGCGGTEPNTVDSMENGVNAGADIIEFDLNFNKNGEPVLSHNEPSLSAVPLSDAFEFLSGHKSVKANVDVKSTSNLNAVAEAAEKYGVTEQIFFTGIFAKDVAAVERLCPQIPFFLNYSVNRKGSADMAYLSHLIEIVKNCGAVGINIHYKSASKQLVKAFHNEGLLVSLWTVNSKYELARTLKLRPDNITTKHPEELCGLLGKSYK